MDLPRYKFIDSAFSLQELSKDPISVVDYRISCFCVTYPLPNTVSLTNEFSFNLSREYCAIAVHGSRAEEERQQQIERRLEVELDDKLQAVNDSKLTVFDSYLGCNSVRLRRTLREPP